MKVADRPGVESEVVVAAPVTRVWALVVDLDVPARFSPEFRGGTWIDDGPALGARFVGRNQHPAIGSWETTSWVTRFEPGRAFAWSVGSVETPAATWWYLLDGDDGEVRLRHGGRIGPGPSGLTPAITAMPDKEERIVARRLAEWQANVQATVEGIKALAEQPS